MFAPKDLVDRVIYLVGAVGWPYCIVLMMRHEGNGVIAFIMTCWTLIAWFYTLPWTCGMLRRMAACIRRKVF